jgi:hypothetical protein
MMERIKVLLILNLVLNDKSDNSDKKCGFEYTVNPARV